MISDRPQEPRTLDGPDELARLRAENQALNEQVKLLVQIEQRLYRTQNARDQEFQRTRALSEFALHTSVLTEPHVVIGRAVALLRDCFSLDFAQAVSWREGPGLRICAGDGEGPAPVPIDARSVEALRSLEALELRERGALAPSLRRLFDDLAPSSGESFCVILPIGLAPAAILASSPIRKRPLYRNDQLAEAHRPFLELVGSHVRRSIQHAALTGDLQVRSERLAELNEQLSESLGRLERTQGQLIESSKMEAIGRLAGGVAHDFNNLLTVILNHAELASSTLEATSEAAEDIKHVMDAGRRAAAITSQLLALGRKQPQRGENLELGEVTEDFGRILQSLLGRGVELDVEAERGCVIFADRTQIEQVILNLALNARDAMPDGGVVRVRIRVADRCDLASLPTAAQSAPWVALEVLDTGTGMDDATRAKIFEPFFTTKDVSHGTGLGLAVVYGVVTQSGGHIEVRSAPGQGTQIKVLFPRRSAPATVATIVPAESMATGSARLLVVEDSAPIRRVVSRILRRAGYEVFEAGDGVEAVARLRELRAIDLMLTDLSMPRMGGFELAEHVARELPSTQVVLMTGFSEELANVSSRAPTWPCITKPFTPDNLLALIAERLQRRTARAS
ncbi:MAG: response regulator [Kofleriaceae bacterium]